MESRNPLTEMSNQRQPRRKTARTYGKKKVDPLRTQRLHQQLFGQDENQIEEDLAKLSLDVPVAASLSREGNNVEKPQSRRTGAASTTKKKKSLVSEEDIAVLTPLQALSDSKIDLFTVFGDKIAKSCQIEKIGEGSFAEVFKLTPLSSEGVSSASSKSSSLPSNASSIIKVIPLEHRTSSASVIDRVSTIPSVTREINLLKHLDILHGFTGFASLRIVKGAWPISFLEAFRTFKNKYRKRAINIAPDQDFDDNQIYALVEMDDAGIEVSLIKRPSVFQVYDIFWTTVILLANAEERIEFEHRDLHLSNICIKPRPLPGVHLECKPSSTNTSIDIDGQILSTMTEEPNLKLGLSNLDITIIDYTVARAKLPTTAVIQPSHFSPSTTIKSGHLPSTENQIVYDSMKFASDPFSRTSSIESTLQFSTYKKCRAATQLHHSIISSRHHLNSLLSTSDKSSSPPQSQNKDHDENLDKYSLSTPLTNTIWLGYLLRSLIRRSRGRTGKLHILPPLPPSKSTSTAKTTTTTTTTTTSSKSKSKPTAKKPSQIQSSIWDSLLQVDAVINDGPDASSPPSTHVSNPIPNPTPSDSTSTSNINLDLNSNSNSNPDPNFDEVNNQIWTQESLLSLPQSARALLDRAVRENWLSEREIEVFKLRVEGGSGG